MDTASLREFFGLSQSQLANWIEVNIGQIKMSESCKRNFSYHKVPLYKILAQKASAGPVPAEQAPPELLANEHTTVGHELKMYILDAQRLQIQQSRELEKMQTTYQQALNRYEMLQLKKKILGYVNQQEPWLEVLINKTNELLQTNGLKAQALLQLKIDSNTYALEKALQLEEQLKAQ